MSNSKLICCTILSPNHSGTRTMPIDRTSVHCMAGNLTVESCGQLFASPSREASSQYGIGSDGRIGQYVKEENRSWCTSSRANDQRAITIEVANNGGAPDWPVSDKAYAALLNLLTDICQRNGKTKVVWFSDKDKALAYEPKAGEMVLTVHRWFAAKACPGDYLFERHAQIANEVNKRLASGGTVAPAPDLPDTDDGKIDPYTVKITVTNLNIRSGPGTGYPSKGTIKPGVYTIVQESDGTGASRWGKLKSGVGWISLDYATRTSAVQAKEIDIGSKVTIKDGSIYGGLAASRGAKVPSYISGPTRRYTVKKIATHKGVTEALLGEITSWVAVSYLTLA